RARDRHKAWRHLAHAVAVAHPNRDVALTIDEHTGEERSRLMRRIVNLIHQMNLRRSIFATPPMRLDFASKLVGEYVHAIADAQHRQAAFENGLIDVASAFIIDAIRTARENDAPGAEPLEIGQRRGCGQHFAVDTALTHPTRNQPAVL